MDKRGRDPDYWVQHLRHTVRFGAGIETLAEDKGAVFVEVGPGKRWARSPAEPGRSTRSRWSRPCATPTRMVDDRAFFTTVSGVCGPSAWS